LADIFYTALYHAPRSLDSVLGCRWPYRAMDTAVRQLPPGANNYSTYSLWIPIGPCNPLFTLIQREADDRSRGGSRAHGGGEPCGPPIWPLQGIETRCMIGWHSAVVLAEAYATRAFSGIDYARAWPVFRKRAFDNPANGVGEYIKSGFIPSDTVEEAVSKTLEYAYDDWAMATWPRQPARRKTRKPRASVHTTIATCSTGNSVSCAAFGRRPLG